MFDTLFNFETYLRFEKVQKARDMFLKGQVVELSEVKDQWVGRIKIGYYKVTITLDGIRIVPRVKCTCDSLSKSGYCEHKIAVLFALRKHLDLYPALTNSLFKLPASHTILWDLLRELYYDEDPPRKKDIKLFTDTTTTLLKKAETAMLAGEYETGPGDCFEVLRLVPWMNLILENKFNERVDFYEKAFDLLNDAVKKNTDEELIEKIAHDARIETLRTYRSEEEIFHHWLRLLQSISDKGNRLEKLEKVMTVLNRVEEIYPKRYL